ncbi:MAG: nucleoside-diphosphate sugar epimerase/dehydratase [Sulfurimonas sp.]|uniref:polysaccharide biosynthesis protein n=1 Tax=Sulfurimonas sp. TaxID=2022749 RepID=UPI0026134056|nr:nucleoside-diphosphate sugar epimerase/dehydratase [Sulfurimonas sp.]MDD2653430.1 nucleoside-diphosphate sugar epimerase/dehydratase [Sulfurimonas sp.]MDD3452627.1 nucleoside-diphosphate sugar epimerase/dehydratase [Sulfurimonas sp.]
MFYIDKRILNFLVIIFLSVLTFWWTFFIFHQPIEWQVVAGVIAVRIFASLLIFKDYSLSWSKATQRTFLLKSVVYIAAFLVYAPFFYAKVRFSLLASELFSYLFSINFLMYVYYYFINKNRTTKTKSAVIYGAGKAGIKLEEEFANSEYKVKYFVDDDVILQKRSIDGIRILSKEELKERISKNGKLDLLVIAMPSASKERVREIYERLSAYFKAIKVLPSFDEILKSKEFSAQLKDISVEDLLARHPKDLDTAVIKNFINGKKVLITGAGGSIGSEIARQCVTFGAKELILLDHSEFNLYAIAEELSSFKPVLVMQSVVNKELLDKTFEIHKPEIVIHAAAYKHVPLVEENIAEAIINNVIGTKNTVDCAIEHGAKKFVLISTDKAVRPTNVMGTTKRICELYAQNVDSSNTEIVAVRFGNVLGSSGSVIPKFKSQIEQGGPITVTHPDITRYFMLIPEACELVLQAASIGKGGEIFILDMGEPIKIADLAKKMIELSGRDDISIEFSGLRPGEKLYEELLIDDSDAKTEYESITVAGKTMYDITKLNHDISELVSIKKKLEKLKEMVPEFNHNIN